MRRERGSERTGETNGGIEREREREGERARELFGYRDLVWVAVIY